jgi:hypothetical protein
MKIYRIAPWLFFTAAILVFIVGILVSAQITSVVASSPVLLSKDKTFNPQEAQFTFLPFLNKAPPPQAIIIDHANRDVTLIPPEWIQAAMQDVIWSYGSTSHGTQLWVGADYLSAYVNPPTYNFLKQWFVSPDQGIPAYLRMGYNSGFAWDPAVFLNTARNMLNSAPQANAFMWSWCGEMSWLDAGEVQHYLDLMR